MIDDKHLFARITKDVREIWQSFREIIDIPYFAMEYYNLRNGKYGLLTSDYYLTQPYLNTSLFPTQSEAHCIVSKINFFVLSPQISFQIDGYPKTKHEKNLKLITEYGLNHRVGFVKRAGDWVENVCFGCGDDTSNGFELLLQNIYLLNKICVHMNALTASLRSKVFDNMLVLPEYSSDYLDFLDSSKTKIMQNKEAGLFKKIYRVTDREFECMQLTAKGQSAKMVAKQLKISPHTVEVHLDHLKQKLNVNNKLGLCEKYYQHFF